MLSNEEKIKAKIEEARKQRKELDEPEEWKIVKIKTIRVLEEIIDE